MCFFKLHFWTNLHSQMLHFHGFSPLWSIMWCFKFVFFTNVFPQRLQVKFFILLICLTISSWTKVYFQILWKIMRIWTILLFFWNIKKIVQMSKKIVQTSKKIKVQMSKKIVQISKKIVQMNKKIVQMSKKIV